MWFMSLMLLVLVILATIAITYLLKESKNLLKNSPEVEEFGCFSFSEEEWEYVNQQEFVEDERGKTFSDKYINIISYGKSLRENARREILFTSQKIFLTDGEKAKSFSVINLTSIDLLHLSPLKKIRVVVEVNQIDAEFSRLYSSVDYLVPIPQSSLESIDKILKAYGKIILDS